jgi:uncharacterized protein (TIGR02996 family)
MPTDAEFLAGLDADPTDDATRLVYADWLDEHGDPDSVAKAEFLRVTAQLVNHPGPKGWKKTLRKRLQALAAQLDTAWLAVVSRLDIENCDRKRTEDRARETSPGLGLRPLPLFEFGYLCDRRWEDLRPTDEPGVRFCEGCEQHVHYCDTITEARRHAWDRHCIAVDLGVIRREGDLEPQRMYVGMPGPVLLRQEQERMQPDAVSAERDRRKQQEARDKGASAKGGTSS